MSAPTMTGPMAGSPAADLLAQVTADPLAPLQAVVGAPGGFGKTALLRELAGAWQRAGVTVVTPWRPVDAPGDQVLLADDAHRLHPSRLDELRAYAERPDARIVVAYRPWPRPAGLPDLIDVLRRARRPVHLAALTAGQIRDRLAAAVPDPPADLVAFVAAQTGGVPRYVARVADALTPADAAARRVPVAALSAFATDLDELDADLRTLLLAVEAGAGLSFDLVAALLERDAETVAGLVDAGRATGLLAANGALVPLARQAIAALGPIGHRIDVRQRLAGLQLARGGPVLSLVRALLGADGDSAGALVPGAAGTGLGKAYEAAGEEALGDDPELAARLFAAAAGAGRTTAARRALATALAGDLDEASRLADQALAAGTPEQRAEAAYVAAAVLTQRGQTAQAAALYRWSPSAVAAGFGAVGLIGTGRPADARALDMSAAGEPPSLLSATAALMARGMAESVGGTPATALSTLVQAATMIEPAGSTVLLPDSPAALGATVALHSAELDAADALLTRAVRAATGGTLLADRHRLLQAWVLLARGRIGEAQAALRPGRHGRDRLFASALRVGLSRRASDLVGLRSAWPDACHALIGQPVDLFTLLPLGELAVAAARLGEQHRVAGQLAEADLLLSALGDPPLWSAPLHWSRLHAAVLGEDHDAAARHARALAGLRGFSPYADAVADAAGQWVDVLTDAADPDAVIAAARGLSGLGLVGDGARLAGQAAIRTADRKAMTLLLECARAMQERIAGPHEPTPAASARSRAAEGTPHLLSEREREVAALVLDGLTYKQVAERLYLSAKTVEHHMARIRQRLGVADRQALLTRLRALIGPGDER
ncbi:helix-turn-helix transcriptional regulator [Actinoplanes sp. ATCC 53533]|uniref:LuxR C-terminal-related transcriptional regulator n=1 Tax=Actinoplanes sp. ATCC 53533 TaxID=1288362 RepID=UPI000F775708|nr:LuxR C-terminal-related transcriptional regulator [Actinoplanes sp. ATCC 53533]RSM50523.1 helix-turn-helix transcriptional regulator [Actinoplanes sp. ATCC 53533]